MKPSSLIPLAIIFGGIIIATAVYVSTRENRSPAATRGNPSLVRPVDSTDHILGNPAAKVMIVEYSDFDCEYCKGFDETLHRIVADAGTNGDVAWVYREFPLYEIHPNAIKNANAAECVAKVSGNDAFWKFKTKLFNSQPIDPSQYGTYAESIGISGDAFANCFADAAKNNIEERSNKDRQNALDIGARGTPYSLILVAGKTPVVMEGPYNDDAVRLLVNEALAGVK